MSSYVRISRFSSSDNYISGEDSEEDDEVSPLINDSFKDDYNPTLYHWFNNVTRNADEATEDALNNQQPQTEEANKYCQESSEK